MNRIRSAARDVMITERLLAALTILTRFVRRHSDTTRAPDDIRTRFLYHSLEELEYEDRQNLVRFVVENLEDSERPYAPWTDKTGLADEFPFATALVPLIAFVEVKPDTLQEKLRDRGAPFPCTWHTGTWHTADPAP